MCFYRLSVIWSFKQYFQEQGKRKGVKKALVKKTNTAVFNKIQTLIFPSPACTNIIVFIAQWHRDLERSSVNHLKQCLNCFQGGGLQRKTLWGGLPGGVSVLAGHNEHLQAVAIAPLCSRWKDWGKHIFDTCSLSHWHQGFDHDHEGMWNIRQSWVILLTHGLDFLFPLPYRALFSLVHSGPNVTLLV